MAALCAAISAREAGASVLMAEAAPRELRGGNTRHSRNLRIAHDAPTPLIPGVYTRQEFVSELLNASDGEADLTLARVLAERSASLPDWLAAHGVVLQSAHIPFSRKTAFLLGGGKTAINALYARAERLGVRILYGQAIEGIDVAARSAGPFEASAIIACCGGAQATAADGFINRGTPFAKGEILRSLLSQGARAVGDANAAHLVAVDARFAAADGGIVTRVDGMEHGAVVDCAGTRFEDETAFKGPARYSSWGRAIAARPRRWAALILDAEGVAKIPAFVFPPLEAETFAGLAAQLGVNAAALAQSARDSGRVSRAPFFAFPIRPGIAFTCHGVKADEKARVIGQDGAAFPGLFAAGMIMAANVLGERYLAGCGMTIGATFGRIAGEEAARYVFG